MHNTRYAVTHLSFDALLLFFIYNISHTVLSRKTLRATSSKSTFAHFSRRPNAQMFNFIFDHFRAKTFDHNINPVLIQLPTLNNNQP